MPEDKKVLSYKIEGSNFVIVIDTNKDGKPLMEIKFNMLEIPSEILSALKKN